MKISDQTMKTLCELAHLNLNDTVYAQLEQDLGRIVTWLEQLKEVATDQVEPLYVIFDEKNQFQTDQPSEPLRVEEALKNAPAKDSHYIHVPKN